VASPPIRNLESLSLADPPDIEEAVADDTQSPDLTNCLDACFKAHRRTTHLLLKHVRTQRKIKYGHALLRMFVQKPKLALQTILRTTAKVAEDNSQPLPTNLSIIRDETTGRFLVEPEEVIEQVRKLETKALSPDPTLLPGAPFPWHLHVTSNQKHTVPMISGCITTVIMQEALRRTPNHKAAGPDGVPGLILKHMPPGFHEALQLLFQAIAKTGITPPSWLHSHTILFYKKEDPATLDNYRPITLANALYKLWTTCIVMLANDYVESRKILSPEREGFRVERSCSRALTHLGLCIEDAHTHNKDIVLCYLYFKGAFPSADHDQLVRTLTFLGLPEDFINIITNLYNGATTKFVTPHGHTPP